MRFEVRYLPGQQKRRWLGYFDLLGTKARIETAGHFQIFDVYARAVEAAKTRTDDMPAVRYACFSDSFLIYTESDSGADLTYIDSVARWFVYNLITSHIPVRGALSCGDFYADKENSIYFGPALIEAHEYGEAQDWLGLLLAPSAVVQMDKLGVPAGKRLNYAYGKIPFKAGSKLAVTELPACILGQWITLNGQNPCVEAMAEMKNRATAEAHIGKYERAIEFAQKNRRVPVMKLFRISLNWTRIRESDRRPISVQN